MVTPCSKKNSDAIIIGGKIVKYRKLGNTGLEISEVSFGTWAIGGAWGKTTDAESLRSLEYAIDQGVNFWCGFHPVLSNVQPQVRHGQLYAFRQEFERHRFGSDDSLYIED